MRRLATVVIVRNERHEAVAFGPNDDVPEWAAKQITNPRAWVGGEPPGLDQLVRVGATPDEVAAIRVAWNWLPEDEREDQAEPISDDEAREHLADARSFAAEKGMTFAEALIAGVEAAVGDADGSSDPAGDDTVPTPATAVEKPNRSASKAAWLTYAISQGVPESEAQAMTRDELADRFGG